MAIQQPLGVILWRITVRGAYPFPIDMLRYCEAWPSSELETGKIALTLGYRNDGPVDVQISGIGTIGHDRWNSFSWEVVKEA